LDYIDIDDAKTRSGLRVVLTAGVPGPWGEAAKGILHVKQIPYAAVAQSGGAENEALREWTGFDNAPQLILDDERPRIGYSEILLLAERLAPEPALIPSNASERTWMFGLLHEIAGPMGWAWARRLEIFDKMFSGPTDALPAVLLESVGRMASKYDYSPEQATIAKQRIPKILELLSTTLETQRENGSPYLVGSSLTAADSYWATFAAMLEPLPDDICPMGPLRTQYTVTDPNTLAKAAPILLEHRAHIYKAHLPTPLDF
jgi:glutathione S-transferase